MKVANIALLLLALLLGLNLPDFDQQLSFLTHRSIITHGFLIPLGIFLAVQKEESASSRFLAIGFSLATAVHLCFDLFPRAWTGFALIHIPFWGRSGALFSWLWISVSIIICLYLVFILIKTLADTLLTLGSLLLGFIFYASTQSGFLAALFALLVAIGITLLLPANGRDFLRRVLIARKE